MKVDEHTVKISATKIPINTELEIGSEVVFIVEGEVVKVEDTPNYDGTRNRCYVVRGVIIENKG